VIRERRLSCCGYVENKDDSDWVLRLGHSVKDCPTVNSIGQDNCPMRWQCDCFLECTVKQECSMFTKE